MGNSQEKKISVNDIIENAKRNEDHDNGLDQRSCDALESRLRRLVDNPTDVKSIGIDGQLSRPEYYCCRCTNIKNFIEQQNRSESAIKFKLDPGKSRNHVRFVSPMINTTEKTITYNLTYT
jgi:hypothetical protein